jgi:chromosome partitioning protein
MRRIAVINQKGGVGKTTTTVNLGMALARMGQKVLMIDLDPQAHMTLHFGQDPQSEQPGSYELLTNATSFAKARNKIANNLWIVGASIDLAAAEVELVSVVGREVILRDLLNQHIGVGKPIPNVHYDYVLIDCPPSLSVLTLNGLCAADEVFIPLQPHYLALQGLGKLLETVSLVNNRINPQLKVGGVVICMYDAGTKLAAEVVQDVRTFLEEAKGSDVPWSEAEVFDTVIRRNIKLAESPSYGTTIFDYAPDSNGAKDYASLAEEVHQPGQPAEANEPAGASEIAKPPAEVSEPPDAAAGDEPQVPVTSSDEAPSHEPVMEEKPAENPPAEDREPSPSEQALRSSA